MSTMTALLNALSQHQGAANGIAAERLAQQLDVPPRRLRKLVSAAREDGIAICGRPATGYFMPVTPEELHETCRFLEHRALHSLRKLSRMKRVALPVLLGQILITEA